MRKHDCHHSLCRRLHVVANVSLQAHKSVNNVIEHEDIARSERTAREINIEVPYARIEKKDNRKRKTLKDAGAWSVKKSQRQHKRHHQLQSVDHYDHGCGRSGR